MLAAGPAVAKDEGGTMAGDWATTSGPMRLDQAGDRVFGVYESDGGRVEATIAGRTVTGFWGETSSAQRCGMERLGTFHWGRLEWRLSDDGRFFWGLFSYCEEEPVFTWIGERRAIKAAPAGK